MNRRRYLRLGAGAIVGSAVAGCLDRFETRSAWADQPLVEDRPDAVYVPASVEEMGTYGTARDGDYAAALLFTFPHRFWTVTGTETNMADVRDDDSLHLMASVWDTETETVLPTDTSVTIRREGELVDERNLWPMISQRMGFHYGDNVALPEDGEYTATIRTTPVQARRRGAFEGRFEESASVEIDFEYAAADVYDLDLEEIDEARRGTPGAVDLMGHDTGHQMGDSGHGDGQGDHDGRGDHAVPTAVAPDPESLPGRRLGIERSGDAEFVAIHLDSHRLADGDGQYLAVSPRTPHNRIVLPLMSLSVTVTRDGETVADRPLPEVLDHELDHHYGTTIDSLAPGDDVRISIDAPPQVSRHDGYETAFLSMSDVEFTVP